MNQICECGLKPKCDGSGLCPVSAPINIPAPPMATTQMPTAGLRFVKRDGLQILQQKFVVTLGVGGVRYEWRDVPLEEGE